MKEAKTAAVVLSTILTGGQISELAASKSGRVILVVAIVSIICGWAWYLTRTPRN